MNQFICEHYDGQQFRRIVVDATDDGEARANTKQDWIDAGEHGAPDEYGVEPYTDEAAVKYGLLDSSHKPPENNHE